MYTIRIRFSKRGEASYISLLDLQRVMSRGLRRSGIPVYYTQGFNPHIYMTFAVPLSLGQESECETMDFKTESIVPDFALWMQALNATLPRGIVITQMYEGGMDVSEIASAKYCVRFTNAAAAAKAVQAYNDAAEAIVQKAGKRGKTTEVNLKTMVPQIELEKGTDAAFATWTLPAGSTFTVNPTLLTGYLEQNCGLPLHSVDILRLAVLTKSQEKFQ